jgi:hypothetical protein
MRKSRRPQGRPDRPATRPPAPRTARAHRRDFRLRARSRRQHRALSGDACLGEPEIWAILRQVGNRAETEHRLASPQARVVVVAAIEADAQGLLVEPSRGLEVRDEELNADVHPWLEYPLPPVVGGCPDGGNDELPRPTPPPRDPRGRYGGHVESPLATGTTLRAIVPLDPHDPRADVSCRCCCAEGKCQGAP